MFFYDPTYILLIPVLILSFYAQSKVKGNYNKYLKIKKLGGIDECYTFDKAKICGEDTTGVKKYEFRKQIFKRNIKKVYIYESYPVKKIVGAFVVGEII